MNVITRFAPSPTGNLHTGSARTALFNWLFSRHHKGTFLLRVEDTDAIRSTQAATDAIIADLKWLGLTWDGEIVFQSKNYVRHQEVAKQMIDNGTAYYCYISQAEIEAYRTENPNAKYQSPWRNKSSSEAPKDAKPVVRLKVQQAGQTVIKDLIQGEISVENQDLDDMVLLRSDGTPTYMLAVVVDDHDMNITHVIRGDDHLTNTFRQKQIYEAMNWTVPFFGHIPLIHDKNGKKLSKREGALGIDTYKEKGYLPQAVNNHLLRLGWGHGNDEIISTQQAIEWFDLNSVGQSPSRFDMDKLNHINSQYLRALDAQKLFELIAEKLPAISDEIKTRIISGMDGLKNRAITLVDLAQGAQIYIAKKTELDDKAKEIIANAQCTQLIPEMAAIFKEIPEDDWNVVRITEEMNKHAQSKNIKASLIMQTLRASVVGAFASPSIYDVMVALGKNETLARINT